MILKVEFYNIKCDCCGSLLSEETWWDDRETSESLLSECGWKKLGGCHYCPDCRYYDDDDNIVTKDGRKFDGETEKEIKED